MDPSTYERVDEAVEDFAHEVGPKSINLTEEIGNGEFGNVYRGVWRVDRKEQRFIAVKTLKVKDLCLGREGGYVLAQSIAYGCKLVYGLTNCGGNPSMSPQSHTLYTWHQICVP